MHVQRTILLAGALCLSLGATGCSLALDWSTDHAPCTDDDECLDGFSCFEDHCLADGSLTEGQTCFQSVQCDTGFCHGFVCRRECTEFFTSATECETGEYCHPVLNRVGNPCGPDAPCQSGQNCRPVDTTGEWRCHYWEGVCTAGADCDPGETLTQSSGCPAGQICVELSRAANACLTSCQITWTTGVYRDNCGSTVDEPRYCQPIGRDSQERLVCLDTADSAQDLHNICTPVKNPCKKGLACVNACAAYCDHNNPAADDYCRNQHDLQTCCAQTSANQPYGLCKDACAK